jgi:hypothetical protein
MRQPLLSAFLLVACALLAAPARAWRWGSGGRARWDFQCQFAGVGASVVAAQPHAASSICGDLCLLSPACSHWSWTPSAGGGTSDKDGTCWLRGGPTGGVSAHGTGTCGFLPERFTLDESAAFDLGIGALATPKSASLTDKEAEALLRTLNFLRLGRGVGRLQLDVRLLLAARDLAATCPAWSNTEVSQLPVKGIGGSGNALALAMVTASDAAVEKVLDTWVSAPEMTKDAQPLTSRAVFSPNVTAVGLAKQSGSYCRTLEIARANEGRRAATTTTVWTLLMY